MIRDSRGNDLPAEVMDALIVFERIFQKFAPIVRKDPKILEDVFDDARMVDEFIKMTPESIQKTTNSIKEMQTRMRQQADLYGNDDSGMYDYGM